MADTTDATTPELPAPNRMTYTEAVFGEELYNFFGNRVVKHTTTAGHPLAIKVKPPSDLDRSEGAMMHYAAAHGVLAPRVRGVFDVVSRKPIATVLVSDFVPGESLDDVWDDLDDKQRTDIKNQLREQIALMRKCTEPFIGRVDRAHARNSYDRLGQNYHGPFSNEAEFDDWCLARIKGSLKRWKWRRFLEQSRRDKPAKFVLTHGDLTPRNIMVKDGKITGIIDWEKSGFYPDYAEYAFAMCLCHEHEEWWIPMIKEILEPCSTKRLEFTRLVEDRGF